jgi:hypothetical protein
VSVSQFRGFISSRLSLCGPLSVATLVVRRDPLEERPPDLAEEAAEDRSEPRKHM